MVYMWDEVTSGIYVRGSNISQCWFMNGGCSKHVIDKLKLRLSLSLKSLQGGGVYFNLVGARNSTCFCEGRTWNCVITVTKSSSYQINVCSQLDLLDDNVYKKEVQEHVLMISTQLVIRLSLPLMLKVRIRFYEAWFLAN